MKKLILLLCIIAIPFLSRAQLNADYTWCPEFDTTAQLCCIQFQNLSTDTGAIITSYYYIFGDGQQSTLESPEHCYVQLGTYIVYLLVADNLGYVDTSIQSISITHIDSTGCHCSSIGVNDFSIQQIRVTLSPNLFHTEAVFNFSNLFAEKKWELKIFNTAGMLVRKVPFEGNMAMIKRGDLTEGLYFYEVQTTDCKLRSQGKFVIE